MEQAKQAKQELGSFGEVSESYSAGVGSVSASAALPKTAFGLSAKISIEADLDAKDLIEYLAQKIGGPVPETVAQFLEAALAKS